MKNRTFANALKLVVAFVVAILALVAIHIVARLIWFSLPDPSYSGGFFPSRTDAFNRKELWSYFPSNIGEVLLNHVFAAVIALFVFLVTGAIYDKLKKTSDNTDTHYNTCTDSRCSCTYHLPDYFNEAEGIWKVQDCTNQECKCGYHVDEAFDKKAVVWQ
jgi:hypothetical protein